MAMSATEQGERNNCYFNRRPPLSLQSSMFIKISWYIRVKSEIITNIWRVFFLFFFYT